jgi:hypothetical protein
MQRKLLNSLNVLFALTFVSMLLVVGIFLYGIVFRPPPSSSTIQQTPASDLEVRVKSLENNLDYLQRDLVFRLDQKLYYFAGAALAISVIAAFFGWRTFKDLDDVIQEKIRTTLENELYQLDPANLTVRLPKGHPDSPLIARRLMLSGLKKIREYPELNKYCKYGLTIVPVNNTGEEVEFTEFIQREKPDPNDAAFVLYVTANPKDFRVSNDTLNQYERVTTANMPSTVISAILAVSRGLHRETETVTPEKAEK